MAGRWAAKEAVIKALSSLQEEGAQNLWIDASAPLKDIEVIRTTGGEFLFFVFVFGLVFCFLFFLFFHSNLLMFFPFLFFYFFPAPFVRLWGHAKKVSEILGVTEIKVSISHAGSMALAQAMCSRA